MPNALLQAALEYEAKGFSVIPLKPRDKVPLIPSWLQYQVERADREQLGLWWRTWPTANLGIITGTVSGVGVIDTDSPEAATNIKPLLGDMAHVPIATTGRGFHLYYLYGQKNRPCRPGILPKVDFKGEAGYVVAPPSIHANGKQYTWVKEINGALPDLPADFVRLLDEPTHSNNSKERFDSSIVWEGVPDGQRDVTIFKYACQLRALSAPYDVARDLIASAAARCSPPLDNWLAKLDQAYKYSPGKGGKEQSAQPNFWPEVLSAQQLIDLPPDPTRWVWDNCLPLRSTSALIAKSYTGKSTFAASLALSVARGMEFLGRSTQRGNVLYVYLDGPIDELKDNFQKIGLQGSDQVFVYAGRKPDLVVDWVTQQCTQRTIKLLIIDTAQKFFGFKEDKYEEKINKMQPMLDLVDEYNFHAMFTYHAAKNSGNTISALGSVASEANARVSLYLRVLGDSGRRIFDTEQNTGKKFDSIGLSDPSLGLITKTGSLREIEVDIAAEKALPIIKENPGSTEAQIGHSLEFTGKGILSRALRQLRDNNVIERNGLGKRGDPFKYYIAGELFEEPKTDPENSDLFGPQK